MLRFRAIHLHQDHAVTGDRDFYLGIALAGDCPEHPNLAGFGSVTVTMAKRRGTPSEYFDFGIRGPHGKWTGQGCDVGPDRGLFALGGVHDADLANTGRKSPRHELDAPARALLGGEPANEIEVALRMPVLALAGVRKCGSGLAFAEDIAEVPQEPFDRVLAGGKYDVQSFVDVKADNVGQGTDRVGNSAREIRQSRSGLVRPRPPGSIARRCGGPRSPGQESAIAGRPA